MNEKPNLLSVKERDFYAMLDALDAKSASILQISSIYLVVVFLDAFQSVVANRFLLFAGISLLVATILFNFFILWFARHPTPKLVQTRIYVFNSSVFLLFLATVFLLSCVDYLTLLGN